ncbi:MAG: hypothetical protein EZS28_034364 [Streblomastix strix]|uniref:Uncharacterized protein n=1 Tax=Streblomastix strix TaxID=222440 RepID=A0A5J4UHD0_9EUKA|nr:MAG: hypothetical protein EZS28_034364 [Streblomastix strix]
MTKLDNIWEYIFELINHGECGFPKHASTRFTCWNRRDTRPWTRVMLGVLTTQCGGGGLLTHRAKKWTRRTESFGQTWDLIKARMFIKSGFFQIFKDYLNETRLATTLRPCPFKGTPRTNKAYKEILQMELEEGITEISKKEFVKCQNPTIIVPKPDVGRRLILVIVPRRLYLAFEVEEYIKDIRECHLEPNNLQYSYQMQQIDSRRK